MGNKNSGNYKISTETKADILADLKAGHGILETAAKFDVSKSTVQVIREKNRDDLPQWKRRTAKRMMDLVEALLEDLQNNYEEIKPGSKSITLGILIDKLGALNGEAGQTVEHRHLHIDHRDVNSLLSDKNTASNTTNTKEKDNQPETRHTPTTAADIIDITPQKESPHESQTGGGGSR